MGELAISRPSPSGGGDLVARPCQVAGRGVLAPEGAGKKFWVNRSFKLSFRMEKCSWIVSEKGIFTKEKLRRDRETQKEKGERE